MLDVFIAVVAVVMLALAVFGACVVLAQGREFLLERKKARRQTAWLSSGRWEQMREEAELRALRTEMVVGYAAERIERAWEIGREDPAGVSALRWVCTFDGRRKCMVPIADALSNAGGTVLPSFGMIEIEPCSTLEGSPWGTLEFGWSDAHEIGVIFVPADAFDTVSEFDKAGI